MATLICFAHITIIWKYYWNLNRYCTMCRIVLLIFRTHTGRTGGKRQRTCYSYNCTTLLEPLNTYIYILMHRYLIYEVLKGLSHLLATHRVCAVDPTVPIGTFFSTKVIITAELDIHAIGVVIFPTGGTIGVALQRKPQRHAGDGCSNNQGDLETLFHCARLAKHSVCPPHTHTHCWAIPKGGFVRLRGYWELSGRRVGVFEGEVK